MKFPLVSPDGRAASLSATRELWDLESLIEEFSQKKGVAFLGFGMQPVTPPGRHLLMKKSRNIFWDRMFGGNKFIKPEYGSDVHLFTISASN